MDGSLRKIRQSSYRPSRSAGRSHAGSASSSRMGSVGPVSTISESSVAASLPDLSEPLKEGIVELTRNSKYAVLQLPSVPNVLRANTEEEVYQASADQLTGHALVITPKATYVWNYTSPEHMPNLIPFTYPKTPRGTQAVLVGPSSGSKEPGLVTVVCDSGLCTYWEAVGRAVADRLLHRRKSIEHSISLYAGEVIENFETVEPAGIIATTSSGRFIFVTLRDQFGKPHITSNTMRGRAQGFLSSIKGAISLAPSRRGIVSIKPGPLKDRTDRQALIISGNGDLSVWECSRAGHSKMLFDNSLKEVLVNYISGVYPHSVESFAVHDVEVFEEQECIFILTSFVQSLEEIFYVLYTVSLDQRNEVKIISAHRLQTFASETTQQPRLVLPKDSNTLFVVFSSAVVLLDTMPKKSEHGVTTRWEDVVSFSSEVEIIGSAPEDSLMVNQKTVRHSGVVIIAENAGVIRIERYANEDRASGTVDVAEQQLEPELARSTIEQAIFYGSKSETHYLDFNVRKEIEFNPIVLQKAFLEISAEILNTSSAYMPPVLPSMAEHLDLRVSHLARLGEYLHHNFNGILSTDARFALLTDLEKANAARALWRHVDARLQQSITDNNVIATVIGEDQSVDALRSWFLYKASTVDQLIADVCAYCSSNPSMSVLVETNMICLESVYSSALGIRNQYYTPVYGLELEDFPTSEPWTSSLALMKAFEAQYELTRKVPNPNESVKDQLVCLVESLCSMYSGRLSWLKSKGGDEGQQAEDIEKKYNEKRGNWLQSLVRIGNKDAAVKIAEQYRIFRSLIEIITEDWKIARTAHERDLSLALKERLHNYIDKFGYPFATMLFQYLVETRQLKVLLTEFVAFDDYLETYLSTGRHGKISWIHDISKRDYRKASSTLAYVGFYSEDSNSNKKLHLSLAKLTALACDNQGLIRDVDNQISIVKIQDSLLSQISSRIGENPNEYEVYTDPLKTSRVHEAFVPVLQRGMSRIVQKKVLGVDELIDTLTLLNTHERSQNFFGAFKLLSLSAGSDEVSVQNRANEKLIWRRLLLTDDWTKIVNTKQKSDKKVREITEGTHLYQTLLLVVEEDILSPLGAQILEDPRNLLDLPVSSEWIQARFPFADTRLQENISNSLQLETQEVQTLINDYGLASWTRGIYSRIAGTARMDVN